MSGVLDSARDGCGTAPLKDGAECLEGADVLQGTEGDDEPGIVGGECPRLKVGVDGLDAIGQPGGSCVLDEARQGAGDEVDSGHSRSHGQPGDDRQGVSPHAGPEVVCVDGMRDQAQAVHHQRMRTCKPAPAGSKAGAPIEPLVVADGLCPGPYELVYGQSSVTGKPSFPRSAPLTSAPFAHWPTQ